MQEQSEESVPLFDVNNNTYEEQQQEEESESYSLSLSISSSSSSPSLSSSSSFSSSSSIVGGDGGVVHQATAEIFLGGVPRNVGDDELMEILQNHADVHQLGTVTSVRLMKDRTTGEPKGFAFATFSTRKEAIRAAEVLNNMEIKGKHVRVTISENRCRLFIGNIPKDLTREELLQQLNMQGEVVTHLDFLKDPDNAARNRGFAFVEYQDHPSAERARRSLSRPQFRMGKNVITVNWADPQPEADDESMSQVKVLYVRNLPNEPVTEEQVKELFSQYGEIEKVVIPVAPAGQKRRDFCFVHFVEKEAAHEAVNDTEVRQLGDRELEVTLAKPMDKKHRDENRLRKQERAMRRGMGGGTGSLIPMPIGGMGPMAITPGRGPGLLSYGAIPSSTSSAAPLLPLPTPSSQSNLNATPTIPPFPFSPPPPPANPVSYYPFAAYPPSYGYPQQQQQQTTFAGMHGYPAGKYPSAPYQQQSASRYHPYQ